MSFLPVFVQTEDESMQAIHRSRPARQEVSRVVTTLRPRCPDPVVPQAWGEGPILTEDSDCAGSQTVTARGSVVGPKARSPADSHRRVISY
jgi:hypothetical protein